MTPPAERTEGPPDLLPRSRLRDLEGPRLPIDPEDEASGEPRRDVMVSMYLVERTELEALDPQFLGSLARDGIAIKGTGLDPSLP